MNNGFFDWLQYLLSFALVIGLLFGSLWALRKLQSGARLGAKGEARLKIVETLSVGPRQKIALVQLDGQDVLLGITTQAITALHTAAPSVPARNGLRMDTLA
jgi:flagellar protein FliO/FliZ